MRSFGIGVPGHPELHASGIRFLRTFRDTVNEWDFDILAIFFVVDIVVEVGSNNFLHGKGVRHHCGPVGAYVLQSARWP